VHWVSLRRLDGNQTALDRSSYRTTLYACLSRPHAKISTNVESTWLQLPNDDKNLVIGPNETVQVSLGWGYVGSDDILLQLSIHRGLGLQLLRLVEGTDVIDHSHDGELFVFIHNPTSSAVQINDRNPIAMLTVFSPMQVVFQEMSDVRLVGC